MTDQKLKKLKFKYKLFKTKAMHDIQGGQIIIFVYFTTTEAYLLWIWPNSCVWGSVVDQAKQLCMRVSCWLGQTAVYECQLLTKPNSCVKGSGVDQAKQLCMMVSCWPGQTAIYNGQLLTRINSFVWGSTVDQAKQLYIMVSCRPGQKTVYEVQLLTKPNNCV